MVFFPHSALGLRTGCRRQQLFTARFWPLGQVLTPFSGSTPWRRTEIKNSPSRDAEFFMVTPRGVEPRLPPWKGDVLAIRRWGRTLDIIPKKLGQINILKLKTWRLNIMWTESLYRSKVRVHFLGVLLWEFFGYDPEISRSRWPAVQFISCFNRTAAIRASWDRHNKLCWFILQVRS